MKKILFWLFPVALFSCEKTVYSLDPADDTYSLQGITYQMEAGDGMETLVRSLHTLTYFNNTSVSQQLTDDLLEVVTASSHFTSDEVRAFRQLERVVPSVGV